MTAFWVLLAGAAAMTLAQDAFPGAAVYHAGWYNAIDAALLVAAALSKRRHAAALFGCAVVVLAGVVSGLTGADTQVVAGSPGASVTADDAGGTFAFPLDGPAIAFRHGNAVSIVGSRGRAYTANLILWQMPRTVVHVTAADARGNHLTITQPTNASFLSPVLLMQQTTQIAGMTVRFDSFSVPAAGRNVKAVLFTKEQTAQLHSDVPAGEPAVLFDVSTRADRPVERGIGLVPDGTTRPIGGLLLGASMTEFPAVVVASGPYLPAVALGAIVVIVGAVRAARSSEVGAA